MDKYTGKKYECVGMVARWRPVHLGQAPVLRGLCTQADHALIGIGSANRYNARNPFTVAETEAMIRSVLADFDNYELLRVDDLDDGPRWRAMIVALFGPLDVFFTANPYVADLLQHDYEVHHPIVLVPEAHRVPIDGTGVRRAMARGEAWQQMVPESVSRYIEAQGLDDRFRREFGLETLHSAIREI